MLVFAPYMGMTTVKYGKIVDIWDVHTAHGLMITISRTQHGSCGAFVTITNGSRSWNTAMYKSWANLYYRK
jgi:hypothetical protein